MPCDRQDKMCICFCISFISFIYLLFTLITSALYPASCTLCQSHSLLVTEGSVPLEYSIYITTTSTCCTSMAKDTTKDPPCYQTEVNPLHTADIPSFCSHYPPRSTMTFHSASSNYPMTTDTTVMVGTIYKLSRNCQFSFPLCFYTLFQRHRKETTPSTHHYPKSPLIGHKATNLC